METTATETNIRTRDEICYRLIASLVQARRNCDTATPRNDEWFTRHTDILHQLGRDILPSGSGIDSGTAIDLDTSTGEKLVFNFGFHHMNESGMYDSWTDHQAIVRASLMSGIDISITGRNRNDIKEYLREVFDHVLTSTIRQTYDPATDRNAFQRLAR